MSEKYDYFIRPLEWRTIWQGDRYFFHGPTEHVVNIYSDEKTAMARKKELERWYFIQNISRIQYYLVKDYSFDDKPYSETDLAEVYDYLVKIFGLNPTLMLEDIGGQEISDLSLESIFGRFVTKPPEALLDEFILLLNRPAYEIFKIPKANQRVFFKIIVNYYYWPWSHECYLDRNGDFASRLDAMHAYKSLCIELQNRKLYDMFTLRGSYAELSHLPLLLEDFVNQTKSLSYKEKIITPLPWEAVVNQTVPACYINHRINIDKWTVTAEELLELNELLIQPFVLFEKSQKEYLEENEKLLPRINIMENAYNKYWLELEEKTAKYPSIADYLNSETYLSKIYIRLEIPTSSDYYCRYGRRERPNPKVLETHFFSALGLNKLIVKDTWHFRLHDWISPQKIFFSFHGLIKDYKILEVEAIDEDGNLTTTKTYQVDSLFKLGQTKDRNRIPVIINTDNLKPTSKGKGYSWPEAFENSFENWLIANVEAMKQTIMGVGVGMKLEKQ